MWGENDTTNLIGWCKDRQLGEASQTLNQELSGPPFISLSIEGHVLSPILYRAGNTATEFGWLAQGFQLTAEVESTINRLPCNPRGFCVEIWIQECPVPHTRPPTGPLELHRTNNCYLYLKDSNVTSQIFYHHHGDSFFFSRRTPRAAVNRPHFPVVPEGLS